MPNLVSSTSLEEPKVLANQTEQESDIVKLIMQIKILLWKNATIFFRKKKILFFMFATPFIICAMLNYISGIASELNDKHVIEQNLRHTYRPMGKCFSGEDPNKPCTSINYSILGDPTPQNEPKHNRIHNLMKYVAERNNFEYGKDVKHVDNRSPKAVSEYFDSHKN